VGDEGWSVGSLLRRFSCGLADGDTDCDVTVSPVPLSLAHCENKYTNAADTSGFAQSYIGDSLSQIRLSHRHPVDLSVLELLT
jgi:hypothetical protein